MQSYSQQELKLHICTECKFCHLFRVNIEDCVVGKHFGDVLRSGCRVFDGNAAIDSVDGHDRAVIGFHLLLVERPHPDDNPDILTLFGRDEIL